MSPCQRSFQILIASATGPPPRRVTAPPMETRSFISVVTATCQPSPSSPRRAEAGIRGVGEEHLVELSLTGDLEERPHLDARCPHVDQERGHPPVLRDIGIRPGHQKTEGRDMGEGGPYLLPVEHPFVAVALCPGGEPGHIRSGARLAEQLAPDLLVGEQRPEVAFLLLRRPVRGDGGGAHAVADRVAHPGRRSAARVEPCLCPMLVPRRQAETAVAHGEVHPGQSSIELLAEELLRRSTPRRKVSQQAVNQLVDVRTHARTL